MATEPHAPPGPEKLVTGSPIENEISSYRAINPLAVVSILLALASILSFADEKFLLASLLGVISGVLALRQMKSQPETWTGTNLAKAGIAFSLAFGIAAFTTSRVQTFIVHRKAEHFAKTYLIKAINNPSLDYALWYRLTPRERKELKPTDVKERFGGPGQGPESFRMAAGQVFELHQVIERDPTAKVEFLKVEQAGYDGITPNALVLLKVHHAASLEKTPPAHSHDHEKDGDAKDEAEEPMPEMPLTLGDYAAALIKNESLNRSDAWWVQDYYYPYKPDSYVEAPKPVDDGHGHGH